MNIIFRLGVLRVIISNGAIISTTDFWKYYDVKHNRYPYHTQTSGPIMSIEKKLRES